MERRVLLIGVGLIGGSLALAIKKEHDVRVIGYDPNEENCKLAKSLEVIDDHTSDLQSEAEQADLIILAAPVEETIKLLDNFKDYQFKQNVIITDVGSTKVHIVNKAEQLNDKGVTFIGGHPMAGSHKSGVGSAKLHLFENAFYVLTIFPKTPEEQVDALKDWLKGTKANFQIMEPEEHDLVTGIISHFPHVMAASLVRQVKSHAHRNEHVTRLAAGGFRDITRIASSSPSMWRDIVRHNRHILLSLLDEWEKEMEGVKRLVARGNSEEIYDYFVSAKKYRDSMPTGSKGAILAFHDLYIDVADHVGVISDVTTILAEAKISITNIRIIEAREDVFGVLRLSFHSEEDRQQAKVCLEQHQYQTYTTM
ncbi:prephenate dehydrogenase [Pseudalkalibacillus salsuginis]|uniref:prephenate dehydrogenase n=1 Tax=Pseudalkalibacillus salsuginis TaxID=2910972 RepID=UPI001F17FB8C|nr:prephenate dehydrogenase [Pseudalkalibacillus salsuginis]MCF6411957.1 prephenate dehydrogenase [Pseudalkalibacillus salsuginis]